MSLKNSMLVCASLALLCSSGILSAQCQDPVPPRQGFTPRFVQDLKIQYSDQYETYANILYPDTTPPSCGWPLLVLVHGLSGSRNTGSVEAYALVTQGFFVVTYDVRAQADARTLNPGKTSKLWSLDEWIDLAEVIEWADRRYPALVDKDRVAVFGDSQGAVHAWAAAAYSGKAFPTNPRRSTPMPKLSAAVARYFVPDVAGAFVPDGEAVLSYLAGFGFRQPNPIVDLDPAFRNEIATALNTGNTSALEAYLRSVPGVDFMAELKQTEVPILTFGGWQDTWSDPRGMLEILDQLPPTTPRRCYLTTGPHGMPTNANQIARQIFLTESWFKRFLKKSGEPVEDGPRYQVAQMPSSNAEYMGLQELWRHRSSANWPPASASAERLHLRSQNRLSTTAAGASEGQSTIAHVVPANYGPAEFSADDGEIAKVATKIGRVTRRFETAAFTKDTEYACLPSLSIDVESSANYVVLGAQISVVDGSSVRVLSSGGRGIRFTNVPSSQRVEIELSPLATIVKAGQSLRLEISNFDVTTPDANSNFRRTPAFTDFTAQIRHNASQRSWLDLEALPYVLPCVSSSETTISITNPQPKSLLVRSSPEWHNSLYVLFLGFSGEGPPQVFPDGSELWMVADPATIVFSSAVNLPIQANFAGGLDANGEATATLDLGQITGGIPPSVLGISVTVGPTFFTFARGFEAGTGCRLRFR